MAFDAGVQPTEFNQNFLTTAEYIELTEWQKVRVFLSDTQNVAKFILVPTLCALIGACIVIYSVHICRKQYRSRQRLKRYKMKLKMVEERKMGSDKDDLMVHDVTGAYYISSEKPTKTKAGFKPIVYMNDQDQVDAVRPNSQKSTVTERFSNRKIPSAPFSNRQGRQSTRPSKMMTTFSTKCTCDNTTLHRPGCKHFRLPDISSVNGALGVNDVNVAMKAALDKVMKYEHELKSNPEMQSILLKYRQRKEQDKQKTVAHSIDKGDWQNVPIAKILERKKQQPGDGSRMGSRMASDGSRTFQMA